MIHDRTATVLSLARNMLMDVDPSKEQTPVRTASLVLVLQTLIDLGTPGTHDKLAGSAERTVMGSIARLGAPDGA